MIARTTPAINGDLSNIGAGTLKKGRNPKYLLRSLAQYSALSINIKKPQNPYNNDGKAAMRSISDTRNFLTAPLA
jgi:hypothetical protein